MAKHALHEDVALVSVDDGSGNGKAKTRAPFNGAGSRRVNAVETLEDLWQILFRNANTGIRYHDPDPRRIVRKGQAYRAPRGCVLDGVIQENEKELP